LNARIAGASINWDLQVFWDDWSGLWLRWSSLWCNCLSSAINDLSVLHETLNHPVILTTAKNTITNAGLAEIKVPIIAGTAVIMLVWDRFTAIVAVN